MPNPIDNVIACLQRNDLAGAANLCAELIEREPGNAEAWHVSGVVEHKRGANDGAISHIRKAIQLKPDEAPYHYNLAVILGEIGRTDEVEPIYREALRLDPRHASAANNLGNMHRARGAFGEALRLYEMARNVEPNSFRARRAVGIARKMIGEVEGAIGCFEEAMAADPNDASTHSDFVFCHQYREGITAAQLGEVHRAWDAKHGKVGGAPDYAARRDANRRIRLGFVSPDLGHHPVGIFLAPLIERMERARFHITAYSDRAKQDSQTERIRVSCDQWRDVHGASDDALFSQIQKDEIDVLFDLTGHTDNNRMSLFTRGGAPLQMTWGGYVGSTGLSAMDYIVCDRYHVPKEVEPHYSEQPLRLAKDYIAYDPPKYAPEIGPVPSVEKGHVTFGCLNNPTKVNAHVAEVWSEILREIEGSRLLLKYKGFDDPAVQERIHEIFGRHGIGPERIEMVGSTTHIIHLGAYNSVDVVLDPFPYSGGLTTCEALWMGVPTVTLPGDTFASRHSLAHLTNAGVTDTIAESREDYVRMAVDLAQDVERRKSLRESLREKVAGSPLCDQAGHAASFSRVIEWAWERWCSGEEPIAKLDNDGRELEGKRIGWIGLGLMGEPMARLLIGAGADLTVANRSAGAMDRVVDAGAKSATSPAELAKMLEGETVILMLKDADVVSEVAGGADGFLEAVRPGTLVIDMGTTSPGVTRWLGEELRARGCSLVDAPVSGGESGAIAGTLTVMAGGDVKDFERAEPIFDVLGTRVTRMGKSGAGQVTKLANQVIVATTIDGVAEALRMAEAAGVDPAQVREALRGGFAESRILEMHGERMVRGDFEPGGRATGQIKDLRYAQELSDELGLELPGLKAQVEIWERMIEAGMGDLDHSGLYAFLGEINRDRKAE